MAKRSTTAKSRRTLIADLQRAAAEGSLAPGDMLPPTRELASKYHLSHATIAQQLQELVDQGLVRMVPRVGVFVTKAMAPTGDVYLVLGPSDRERPSRGVPWVHRLRAGFERRVAQCGGSSMLLPLNVALDRHRNGGIDALAGVLDLSGARELGPAVPASCEFLEVAPLVRTTFYSLPGQEIPAGVDVVNFDDVHGGRQATDHLVDFGCERIAFLGLHTGPRPTRSYAWSRAREMGWADALARAGRGGDDLAYLPSREPAGFDDETATALQAARPLARDTAIDGVVCANDHVALALLDALVDAGRPHSQWPAIVGFDGLVETESVILSSLRLPWGEVGENAADLLWRRRTGRLTGPPQRIALKMSLIPRMSSRPAWSSKFDDILQVAPSTTRRDRIHEKPINPCWKEVH